MQNTELRDFLESEFIHWQITHANINLDTLKEPYKIPHAQHWVMLESLYKFPLIWAHNGTRPALDKN